MSKTTDFSTDVNIIDRLRMKEVKTKKIQGITREEMLTMIDYFMNQKFPELEIVDLIKKCQNVGTLKTSYQKCLDYFSMDSNRNDDRTVHQYCDNSKPGLTTEICPPSYKR